MLTDSVVDLVAERVDIAVRQGVLQDSTLVALPLLKRGIESWPVPGGCANAAGRRARRRISSIASACCSRYRAFGIDGFSARP